MKPTNGFAQKKAVSDTIIVVSDTTDIDALFKRARNLAYNKEYIQSRKILNAILDSKQDYYDVRSFLGRTYAWDQQYNEARTEFSKVLIEKPDFADALDALIDVEIWTEQFTVANEYIKIALGYFPTSELFLMKKVKVSLRQQDKLTASLTLRKILELNPGNKDALKMLNETGGLKLNNHLTFGYVVDFYNRQNTPQQLSSVEYGKSFKFASLSLRGNYADKFGKGGWQGELDAYVNFVKGTYAYLNGGYSQVSIFPDYKFGGDIYQKLFGGFEMSLGARYLHFDTNDSLKLKVGKKVSSPRDDSLIYLKKNQGTLLYTVYLGNYFRNYWFSLRAYYTPQITLKNTVGNSINKDASTTLILNIRYYVSDADNYIGIKLGSGRSPDVPSAATLDPATLKADAGDPATLKSYSGGVEIQRAAFGRWLVKGEMGYTREQAAADRFFQRITLNISLKNIF
ncbi:MAG: YaiO family outer membrane beta-barrel protein [Bacteroidota bacterium]